ncbi:hypothetical protein KQX54_020511 [Cotesia glomerata]|uniref:Uncharacterized protein n=1 Tax=Cotesia glomerata TaxID=32391 RepID=A0AAV7IE69_COTGL|nr:hypothetical protein KQX54_020511 [Cotesia glomerata]
MASPKFQQFSASRTWLTRIARTGSAAADLQSISAFSRFLLIDVFVILESDVLEQDNLDVKPYKVDGKFYAAHYPADHYKQRYYNVPQSNLYSQNPTIFAILESGVLEQDNLDVKPYKVDGKFYAAHYPADHYKQRYYNVPQSNLYSQNPTIFAYVDAPAVKPKQTHEALNCGQELIEYSEDSKESSNSDNSLESLESQSENNYCYCAWNTC